MFGCTIIEADPMDAALLIGKAHVRFDEREPEPELWMELRHRLHAKAGGKQLLPDPMATAPVLDSTR